MKVQDRDRLLLFAGRKSQVASKVFQSFIPVFRCNPCGVSKYSANDSVRKELYSRVNPNIILKSEKIYARTSFMGFARSAQSRCQSVIRLTRFDQAHICTLPLRRSIKQKKNNQQEAIVWMFTIHRVVCVST